MNKNKIKKVLRRKVNFVAKPMKNYIANEAAHRANVYANYYEELEIVPKTILFEARDGQSFTDNCYALYRALLDDERFADYRFFWSYSDEVELADLVRNFYEVKQTTFVKRNSDQYLRLLASVQYLVNNSTFQNFFIKKEGQVYINTWHGTPLKTMGFDIPDDPYASQNVLRNFIMADYLLSPNAQTTKMYLQSYKLDGLYDGTILEGGYPRVDLTLNSQVAEVYAKLAVAGIQLDYAKPTILYTPTWKGKDLKNPTLDIEQMLAELNYLRQHCGEKYNFLVKVHPYAYPFVKDEAALTDVLVPDYYDANELMAITDLLITDYSSIFFDFLVTGRPILFYAWDKELYEGQRGLYLEEKDLPGPVLSTVEEVVQAVENISQVQNEYASAYAQMKSQMCTYEDGQASQRYINRIFFQEEKVYEPEICHHKKRIILFPGLLKNNGITMSAINLLNNIDYERYDVTLFLGKTQSTLEKIPSLNPNARLIFKFGYPVYNVTETYLDELVRKRSVTESLEAYYPEQAYVREARRLSGGAHFDVAIDFSGYAYRWSKYILSMDADRKLVYQHNDLWAEMKEKREHFTNLRGIFTLYKKYDAILGVSPSNSAVNRAKLKEYAPAEKFQYCINSIDIDRILERKPEQNLQVNNPWDLKEVSKTAYVHAHQAYTIIPDLSQMNQYYTRILSPDQTLEVTMFAYRNGKKYAKILVNHIYVGWLAADQLYSTAIEEQETAWKKEEVVTCEAQASVSSTLNVGVYATADQAFIDKEAPYTSYWLCDLILNVKEWMRAVRENEAGILETKTVAHLYLDEHNLGWIDAEVLCPPVSQEAIAVKHFMQDFICTEVATGFYYVGEGQEIQGYADLRDLEAQEKQRIFLEDAVLKQLSQIKTTKCSYAHVMLEDGRDFWLDTTDLEAFDYADVLLEEGDASVDYEFNKARVPLYPSIEAYQWQMQAHSLEDYMQVVSEATSVHSDQVVRTATGLLYRIQYEGKEYFIPSECLQRCSEETGLTDILGNPIPTIHPENMNLVTMGRLSEEKNQLALIQAIRLLLDAHPEWQAHFRLYIIGDGRLRKRLLAQIQADSLEENVFLLGQQENPFAIMKQCDCFILPSLYEGQPMVLLESLTLGMDTMATDITSNRYVLENGKYGKLIPNTSAEAIADSIAYYYTEHPQFAHFDYEAYNRKAMQNFYDQLQGEHQ